jgi:hypothetical protein
MGAFIDRPLPATVNCNDRSTVMGAKLASSAQTHCRTRPPTDLSSDLAVTRVLQYKALRAETGVLTERPSGRSPTGSQPTPENLNGGITIHLLGCNP